MRYCMKRMSVLVTVVLTLALGTGILSCTGDNSEEQEMTPEELPGGGNGSDDGDAPDFDPIRKPMMRQWILSAQMKIFIGKRTGSGAAKQ